MNALAWDRLAKRVSRRGLATLFGIGLPLSRAAGGQAKGVGRCGGRPTRLTRLCGNIGACNTDEDCAEGCACIERRYGCCTSLRRKRGKPRRRLCVDGAPRLYCTPATTRE
jgi:hypothetical protein